LRHNQSYCNGAEMINIDNFKAIIELGSPEYAELKTLYEKGRQLLEDGHKNGYHMIMYFTINNEDYWVNYPTIRDCFKLDKNIIIHKKMTQYNPPIINYKQELL
jgi:hypothetical protein